MNQRGLLLILLLLLNCGLKAQETTTLRAGDTFRKATELFTNRQFAAASTLFGQISKANLSPENTEKNSLLQIDALYYQAVCAAYLESGDAQQQLQDFINCYPFSHQADAARSEIGNLYFRAGHYDKAREQLLTIHTNHLTKAQLLRYEYELGYCYFVQPDYINAQALFSLVKTQAGEFQKDAIYYYAYIAYLHKDYATALTHFQQLEKQPKYQADYALYVAQMHVLMGNFQQAIDLAEPALQATKVKKTAGTTSAQSPAKKTLLLKVLASAYFQLANYAQAASYFTAYQEASKPNQLSSSQDLYQMGYALYQVKNYQQSIQVLQALIHMSDIYAQFGLFTLGNAFLQTENKEKALAAFGRLVHLSFNDSLRADALLQVGKLAYETGANQKALSAVKELLEKYPDYPDRAAAQVLLGEILLGAQNYKAAITVLKSLKNKDKWAEIVYQKVCYLHAIELYNDRNFKAAINLFDESLQNSPNRKLELLALFWKAEAWFELGQYKNAILAYQDFFDDPYAAGSKVYKQAYYSWAYAYFMLQQYSQASKHFTRYLSLSTKQAKASNDAVLRLGDCFFALKNYDMALAYYQRIIHEKGEGTDYAWYQKALILGIQNRFNEKVQALSILLAQYPKSTLAPSASYELASTYALQGKNTEAQLAFTDLIKAFPSSTYVPEALIGLGLSHYNARQDSNALAVYKNVISHYPSSLQAKEAALAIKNIYIQQGDAGSFIDYIKTVPGASISASEQDSLRFAGANKLFMRGDCAASIVALSAYIKEFPQGYFINQVYFNRAACYRKLANPQRALADYLYLTAKPASTFTEQALLRASGFLLDEKRYSEALPLLERLVKTAEKTENYGWAIKQLMQTYYALERFPESRKAAQKLLRYEKVLPSEIALSYLYQGKASLQLSDTLTAKKAFQKVGLKTAGSAAVKAEANYLLAEITSAQGAYENSKKICFEVINNFAGQDFWLGKSFLLLANNYWLLGDAFQASSTLQSIIDNYSKPDDGILEQAKANLTKISEQKKDHAK